MARILVIDDDRMMRELYQEILTRRGHAVILAENGTEGLAKVEENPDLIIVDLTMADGDGYEFLKRLRAIPGRATTPVIVSSGQRVDRARRRTAVVFSRNCFVGNGVPEERPLTAAPRLPT